jgi:hypothetical protein
LALKDDQKDKEKENKRHTMSHPPDHIPELDSPRQSRSPIKKDKKERVSTFCHRSPSANFKSYCLVIGRTSSMFIYIYHTNKNETRSAIMLDFTLRHVSFPFDFVFPLIFILSSFSSSSSLSNIINPWRRVNFMMKKKHTNSLQHLVFGYCALQN